MHVLILEDDAHIGRAVRMGLERQGHVVDWAQDDHAVVAMMLAGKFDVLLLDTAIPRRTGIDLLKRLRGGGCSKPVLAVTTRVALAEFITEYGSDADDFIVRPFDLDELGARLRIVTFRGAGLSNTKLPDDTLQLDAAARTVKMGDRLVLLTEREFDLLSKLLAHRGNILSKVQLRGAVTGWNEDTDNNSVEVHVHHLRRKLGRDFIKTVQGLGYLIEDPTPDKK